MIEKISPKQRRIIKAKIKGTKLKDIGNMEYPNATERSKEVLVSRELNKPHVAQYLEQSKLLALKEHNITWSRIIKPISEALDATKVVILGKGEEAFADVQPDHTTRLSATKQARELLEKPPTKDIKEELTKLANGSTELEIVQAIFKK